jgi:Ca2+-binding EF-hand superfamily protein
LRTYRFQSTLDRLNEEFDLPEDFHRSDANADGQIAMSEFASEWPESKVKEFLTLDKNGDGIITAAEYVTALEGGFKAGSSPSSRSPTSSTASTTSTPTAASSATAAAASSTGSYTESQPSSSSASPSSAASKYAAYAQGLVKQYDKNGDGTLDKDEAAQIKILKTNPDADGDGKVTADEIAQGLAPKS